MHILDYPNPDPARQLACDEALLQMAEDGEIGECLRIHELKSNVVVLGLQDEYERAALADKCQQHGVAILRRRSGGGAVILGPGCLLYSVILSREREGVQSVRASYRWILGRLCEAFAERGLNVEQAGISDLVLNGRKVGGSAQQRKRRYLLHHGTLLYDFDIELMQEFLGDVRSPPTYRQGRSHEQFVANLPIGRARLRDVILDAFGPVQSLEAPFPGLHDRVERLRTERYACPGWIERR
mgnify:CR=1 FL=1